MNQNARGTRDFLPSEQILRQKIMGKLRTVFERFGYSPLDTPALERFETLSAKYAGGEEILKEAFRLKDQGERELGLRYDLTVPLARVVTMHPDLKMPFKCYHIDKVWRDGPVSAGRYREFMQCDVDVIGSSSRAADAEMIQITDMGFVELGLEVEIRVNSIHVLNGIMSQAGIPAEKRQTTILTLDKLAKAGEEAVRAELREKGVSVEQTNSLFELAQVSGSNEEKLNKLREKIHSSEEKKGLQEIHEILLLLSHPKNKVVFDPSLARGLSYYTGIVVETFLVDSEIKSAVCSGGRYDGLIGSMAGTGRQYPAVGISFGLDRIFDAMHHEATKTVTQALVIPIGTEQKIQHMASELRKNSINTEIAFEKGLSKALDYANSIKIPFCVIAGEKELSENKVKLKNMETGEENLVALHEAIEIITKAI
ncbi:MAG TPA: histidine--tRNA ligase [Candidatus Nanoarchaeia archaeon]|nr:histidine--tRNA ligase [Candidatus Nanoarchaeia archaeon]